MNTMTTKTATASMTTECVQQCLHELDHEHVTDALDDNEEYNFTAQTHQHRDCNHYNKLMAQEERPLSIVTTTSTGQPL